MLLVPASHSSLACPFCGLLCDDLDVAVADGLARPEGGVCPRAEALFPVPATARPRVRGEAVPGDAAYRAAARHLAAARRPLVGGLACDVAGQRAALDLAERLGGVLDHMNGGALFRNTLAFQDGGWITTTLSEVRNRADFLLLAGTRAAAFPRFFSRLVAPASQFGEVRRRVVALLPEGGEPGEAVDQTLLCPPERLGELFAALAARLAGRRLDATAVAGIPIARLDALLAEMRAARYGVLVWNAAELDFPGAELVVRAMADLVAALNQSTRWAGLPLGGSDGGASAAQTCAWRTGYPSRVAFEAAGPRYEPIRFAGERLLAAGEADALVWISAFDPARTPPPADCPVIVLGRADMAFTIPPDVFIPVAVPGVQRPGFLHRMDGVVALPLGAPAPGGSPGVADALAWIMKELDHAAA